MASFRELLQAAKSAITEVDTAAGEGLLAEGYTLLDVREPDEYEQGAIPGSIHIPRGQLESNIENRVPDRDTRLVVMCAGGVRSAFAVQTLEQLGYANAVSMDGGFNKWKDEGREWKRPRTLSPDQRSRYQRHLLVPEIGEEGQLRLLDSKVLLLGAVDSVPGRAVSRGGRCGHSRHHRHGRGGREQPPASDPAQPRPGGERKVDSAKKTLTGLNSDVDVVTYDTRLGADNIMDILAGYDVVVDGADNFPSRYLLNDASVKLGIPVVHGSIFRFEGRSRCSTLVRARRTATCSPRRRPPSSPSCAEAGVLGVLPGIVGSIQALEAISLLLGIGEPLRGRLVAFDALEMSFREVQAARRSRQPGHLGEPGSDRDHRARGALHAHRRHGLTRPPVRSSVRGGLYARSVLSCMPDRSLELPIRRRLALLRDRSPLPACTTAIAVGLLVNGLSTYVFLVLARRNLGDEAYGGLAVLWGLVYILGPGLFQPLEQELARATAAGAAKARERTGPAPGRPHRLRRGRPRGAGCAGGLAARTRPAPRRPGRPPRGADPRHGRVHGGRVRPGHPLRPSRVPALRLVLRGRGGRPAALAIGLAVIGIEAVGAYAMCVAIALAIATTVGIGSLRPFVKPGPLPLQELTPPSGGSRRVLGEAFMLNGTGRPRDHRPRPGRGRTRGVPQRADHLAVPLFFFQAVKAALLPTLAHQASDNDLTGFRDTQLRLVSAVIAVAAVSVIGMAVLGPWLVETAFGDTIGSRDMALLAQRRRADGHVVAVTGLGRLDHARLAVVGFIVGSRCSWWPCSSRTKPSCRSRWRSSLRS
ncbi:MAG: ThiF family adenylyltransferase [Acidimicrobiales bacterium]